MSWGTQLLSLPREQGHLVVSTQAGVDHEGRRGPCDRYLVHVNFHEQLLVTCHRQTRGQERVLTDDMRSTDRACTLRFTAGWVRIS